MKELTIEQKAQRYDEALKAAIAAHKDEDRHLKATLERIFPELKESGDERIRKSIINYFKRLLVESSNQEFNDFINKEFKEYINWLEKQGNNMGISEATKKKLEDNLNRALEKETPESFNEFLDEQGEQKPADKVEPKFKVSDIIYKPSNSSCPVHSSTDGTLCTVIKVLDNHYILDTNEGKIQEPFAWQDYYELVEQKPADRVKLKFNVGDWVVYREDIWKIGNIALENYYELLKTNNEVATRAIKEVDENAHLWTIQDAKDGDVLACENGWTCIFKKLVNDETFSSYCFMDNTKWFCETGSECHTLKEEFVKAYNGKIYPATKEQHDLLFTKMKEAGYEWDAEKKELKKIEQSTIEEVNGEDYGIDSLYHAQRILEKTLGSVDGYQSDDGILEHKCAISAVKKLYEQKYAWSEEDEHYKQNIIDFLKHPDLIKATPTIAKNAIDWLKSLKDRVQPQPKQGWSKEDEEMWLDAVKYLELFDAQGIHGNKAVPCINWLKNLRDRVLPHWKPSEEQMAALKYYLRNVIDKEGVFGSRMIELYEDLRNLRK